MGQSGKHDLKLRDSHLRKEYKTQSIALAPEADFLSAKIPSLLCEMTYCVQLQTVSASLEGL